MQLKYFNLSEFDCKTLPGSGEQMKPEFLEKIDKSRSISNVPYSIKSGFRTPAGNAAAGGKTDSAHLKGYAADIAAPDGRSRYLIVKGLMEAGFTRIGIGRTYVHADCDPSLPQQVIWHYY